MFARGAGAVAVTDYEAVNTRQVEHHEVLDAGGDTRIGGVVSKPDDEAGGSEGGAVEELSTPYLRNVSINNLQ
jgi:hypothetical protein